MESQYNAYTACYWGRQIVFRMKSLATTPRLVDDAIHPMDCKIWHQQAVNWDTRLNQTPSSLYRLETTSKKWLLLPAMHHRQTHRLFVEYAVTAATTHCFNVSPSEAIPLEWSWSLNAFQTSLLMPIMTVRVLLCCSKAINELTSTDREDSEL